MNEQYLASKAAAFGTAFMPAFQLLCLALLETLVCVVLCTMQAGGNRPAIAAFFTHREGELPPLR